MQWHRTYKDPVSKGHVTPAQPNRPIPTPTRHYTQCSPEVLDTHAGERLVYLTSTSLPDRPRSTHKKQTLYYMIHTAYTMHICSCTTKETHKPFPPRHLQNNAKRSPWIHVPLAGEQFAHLPIEYTPHTHECMYSMRME